MGDNTIQKLKDWLLEKKANYVTHYDMMGDTEGGFYETDEFNFDDLLKEIDAFSAAMKKEGRK